MDPLATPLVAVVADARAFLFRRASAAGSPHVDFAASETTVDGLARERPGTVFESGHRWQMVPARLYRYEDRYYYLRGRYPTVPADRVGVASLPRLGAMGVYDRHAELSEELYGGHHVAELLLAASQHLTPTASTHALAYVLGEWCWVVLVREGRTLYVQPARLAAPADAVFAVASTLQHFGVRPAACPLYLGGGVAPDGQTWRALSVYFDLRELPAALGSPPPSGLLRLLLALGRALRAPAATG